MSGSGLHSHGFRTHALCVLYLLRLHRQVSRDRLHSLGIVNAPMAVKDAGVKAIAMGYPITIKFTDRDPLTNDAIWQVVDGMVPPVPAPIGFFNVAAFDHNSREYVAKLREYECRTCGRQPRYLPTHEADGVLRGYCPEHGLTAYQTLSPDGLRPFARDRSKFDFDLRRSNVQEDSIAALLLGNGDYKVELKHDMQAWETGRIFVETRRYKYGTGEIEPSGLSVTEADVYIQTLEHRGDIYILDVNELRYKAASLREVSGGDGNRSLGVLIYLRELPFLRPPDLWKRTEKVLTTSKMASTL